ncbi:MAG: hypothetical protein ACRENE_05080 [Polyangiaceae bacterium]
MSGPSPKLRGSAARRAASAGLALIAVVAVVLGWLPGCAQEEYPMALWNAEHPDAGSPADGGGEDAGLEASGPRGPLTCKQSHAVSMPSRLEAIGSGAMDGGMAEAAVSGTTYTPELLFERFNGTCGACHGKLQGLGGFQIQTTQQFETNMTAAVIAHVTSDGPRDPSKPEDPNDPTDPMPPFPPGSPTGKPYSQRTPDDLVRVFAELVQQWLSLDKPGSFFVPDATNQAPVQATIPIPNAQVGNAMTNEGNCVPSPSLFGIEKTKSAALDAVFAAATRAAPSNGNYLQQVGLPQHLRDTDLFTFDSATLAQYGVVAYVPTYPLWSENSVKLRHVRVPRGTSIKFDKSSQSFAIPPNTRFYKTFTKQVIDTDGSLRYRKIETRLIVSRPDTAGMDGPGSVTALYGTYKWNDDESDAVLVESPYLLHDNTPWIDLTFVYQTDEPAAAQILAKKPPDSDEALVEGQAGRHYAIPGSARCVACHEGSWSQNFVLGFNPLQINQRPTGTGGVIEETGPDELTQLQRFIDYGLITGMDSPADVVPLEKSEGDRSPRNNYELVAQGYMFGNCSHCHNPHGNPSVANPILIPVLNFLPSPTSGIFQFPLEKYSPRIFRGATGETQIPYITPSLMDMPRLDPQSQQGFHKSDPFLSVKSLGDTGDVIAGAAFAPWRSLIYRNVDNPFAYTDDFGLFPHMPANTAGYDPRAKQIVADWMVSIPAIRKRPDTVEYSFFYGSSSQASDAQIFGNSGTVPDPTPQPYAEVLAGDPRAATAAADAVKRLQVLHTGVNPDLPVDPNAVPYSRYADPGEIDDILDPAVVADPVCHSIPMSGYSPIPGAPSSMPVPLHDQWVVTDSTQPVGPYSPRRGDWANILVEQTPPAASTSSCGPNTATETDQATAVKALQSVTLDSATRTFLTTPVPFGLWEQKPGCDFSHQPKVSDFTGAPRPKKPLWMELDTGLSPSAPVYTSTPGEAVFKMICINCHGPRGDASGRMADNLATMTGGFGQVANFRAGLFGPATSPGANMTEAFGTLPDDANDSWKATTVEDRASRYMAWMALGGTEVILPQGVLTIVQQTKVLDQHRGAFGVTASANMLALARGICTSLLGSDTEFGNQTFFPSNPTNYRNPLIHSNGDAELWLNLCSWNNPPPVHVLAHRAVPTPFENGGFIPQTGALINAARFPATGYKVGNDRGGIEDFVPPGAPLPSGQSKNLWPWCIPAQSAVSGDPICPPDSAFGDANSGDWVTADDAEKWEVRGAINAGLGVFLYVKSIEPTTPPPDFDQCENLP